MTTKSRTLEITALSAEELRIDNKFIKKNAYAVFSIDPRDYRMTKIDALGGSYPSWNEKFVMELPAGQSFIIVEVKIRSSSGDRSVGSAKVPVSEFLGGYAPENCLQFLSFRLWDARGHRNGIVNFSVRVKGAEKAGLAVGSKMGIPIDDGMKNFGGGGAVTGIPVNMPWNSLRA